MSQDRRSGNGAYFTGGARRLGVTAAPDAAPMAPILLRGRPEETLAQAKSIGYDGIEIHVPDIWNFDAAALAAACRETAAMVSALVSGQLFVRKGLNLSDDDPAIVAKALEGLALFVDAASVLRCGVVVGWVRGRIGGRDKKTILARQGEALARIDALAKEKDVPLYIEVINRYELDSLNTARETMQFIRDHNLTNTFVHLDTFHMNIEEYSQEAAIRHTGPLLGYVHIADNTRRYPGCGCLDFNRVFAALDAAGYAGFVTVECLPLPGGPEAAARAMEFIGGGFF